MSVSPSPNSNPFFSQTIYHDPTGYGGVDLDETKNAATAQKNYSVLWRRWSFYIHFAGVGGTLKNFVSVKDYSDWIAKHAGGAYFHETDSQTSGTMFEVIIPDANEASAYKKRWV